MEQTLFEKYYLGLSEEDRADHHGARDNYIELIGYKVAEEVIKDSATIRDRIWSTLVTHGCPPTEGEIQETIDHIVDAIYDWKDRMLENTHTKRLEDIPTQ